MAYKTYVSNTILENVVDMNITLLFNQTNIQRQIINMLVHKETALKYMLF